jgi:hypothetical protein
LAEGAGFFTAGFVDVVLVEIFAAMYTPKY